MDVLHLKAARNHIGLTQEEAAKALGISKSAYVNYEQGNREPNNAMLCKLADLYGVTADYLLGRSDCSNPYFAVKFAKNEKQLLDSYFNLTDKQRKAFIDFIEVLITTRQAQTDTPNRGRS